MLNMSYEWDNDEEMINEKGNVLEIILCGQHVSESVYKLRLSLFLQAASHYFKDGGGCLEPFPACFYDPEARSRRYEDLKMHIQNIPILSEITEKTELPKLTWQLLNWIFTNPLNIEAFTASCESSDYHTDEIRDRYKLPSIPYSSKSCTRFQIFHPESNKKQRFLAAKNKFGSFFAYHGSPSHNIHSIIHRGLVCSLNKRSAYGYGTYITSNLDTARQYAQQHYHGIANYIAIIEVVRDPSVKVVDFGYRTGTNSNTANITPQTDCSSNSTKYFVVDNDDLMQLRQLLVFESKKIFN